MSKIKEIKELALRILNESENSNAICEGLNDIIEICNQPPVKRKTGIDKEKIIESCKFLFEKYPKLKALPIYRWGRYYSYECAGEDFGDSEEDLCDYRHREIKCDKISYDLLDKISENINNDNELGQKYYDIETPERKHCVKEYNFDEKGGRCLVIVKTDDVYELTCVPCGDGL